ncbi:hypothetical protein SCP_0309450 [Sparassis crispa]|uniref:Aminoacyl-tRNA synthetase class Ia domain-containing protein n=1 Tax=Sparassis crispa TaxID=139825 RepID=A0A401GGB1_9APHY|nr:hypothetical protein SCP_0309450 [Sparassis crispa]GBE81218.1 hypothetical protein SCP_0309450 [Sparassis crispa]
MVLYSQRGYLDNFRAQSPAGRPRRDVKKMSKSQKNYPDPNDIINLYDADATRMFLVNSPVVRGDNLRFREEGVREVVSRVLPASLAKCNTIFPRASSAA